MLLLLNRHKLEMNYYLVPIFFIIIFTFFSRYVLPKDIMYSCLHFVLSPVAVMIVAIYYHSVFPEKVSYIEKCPLVMLYTFYKSRKNNFGTLFINNAWNSIFKILLVTNQDSATGLSISPKWQQKQGKSYFDTLKPPKRAHGQFWLSWWVFIFLTPLC